eukprot:gene24768-33245_t
MALSAAKGKTMFDKIWEAHLVDDNGDNSLIYIDRHLVHEVTSPQAFEGLRVAKRIVRRPDNTLATVDHNVPTSDRSSYKDASSFIQESASRIQVLALEENVKDFGLTYFGMDDSRQGIVHIIGPEQGFTLPGTTIVCGDSHTATHGAFGALAFGIGTSEVEHVLATQTLVQSKAKNMRVTVKGPLGFGVTSKDVILHIIGVIGTAGGTGHVIEFAGESIAAMSMEARMSICNMAIEAGARAGMVAPDEITYKYLRGRPMSPPEQFFDSAVEYWRTLSSDADAQYDKEVVVDAADIQPTVTWGTSPQDVAPIDAVVPDPAAFAETDPSRATSMKRSLEYMGLNPGTALDGLQVDKVFIGSCTNARIEDIRAAAAVAKGRKVAPNVKAAMVVPGSGLVKAQAEDEGLHDILRAAGFDWREPGCSMCLAMNPDKLEPGERCASTSNRNFEGRQAMAAAAAVAGYLTDVRKFLPVDESGRPSAEVVEEDDVVAKLIAAMTPRPGSKPVARITGQFAFNDLRYESNGQERPDFVLNQPKYRKSSIIVISFEIDPFRKHCLLNGLDDIGLTMQKVDKIAQFEKQRALTQPWLDNAAQPFNKITLNTALAGLIIWNLQQLHVQRSEDIGNHEKDREELASTGLSTGVEFAVFIGSLLLCSLWKEKADSASAPEKASISMVTLVSGIITTLLVYNKRFLSDNLPFYLGLVVVVGLLWIFYRKAIENMQLKIVMKKMKPIGVLLFLFLLFPFFIMFLAAISGGLILLLLLLYLLWQSTSDVLRYFLAPSFLHYSVNLVFGMVALIFVVWSSKNIWLIFCGDLPEEQDEKGSK